MTFSNRPVIDVLAESFPITIKLALMALAIEIIFGIGFGILAGLKRAVGSIPRCLSSAS